MEQNIAKYRAFVTAVNVGSLSEAARILNYSQSGISRMIADHAGCSFSKEAKRAYALPLPAWKYFLIW